ncbi:hypothetical protein [Calderihabitans maritimus]|uniref:Uncharacterized protein n=1 Tax=Calderihabitans maritimus TaxID=1246530 RepID=A0A1Z5HTX8_9FIRM|nr:hypothetical protein [Calderihabitans maritimus]GAW92797.1 hypothetical protein KKC1_19460 [Calderihabitans maritimus]
MTVLGVVTLTSLAYIALVLLWVYWLEDYFEQRDNILFGGDMEGDGE